jgi:hypothetical protein
MKHLTFIWQTIIGLYIAIDMIFGMIGASIRSATGHRVPGKFAGLMVVKAPAIFRAMRESFPAGMPHVVFMRLPGGRRGMNELILVTREFMDLPGYMQIANLWHEEGHRVHRHLDQGQANEIMLNPQHELEADAYAAEHGHAQGMLDLLTYTRSLDTIYETVPGFVERIAALEKYISEH